MTKLEEIRTLQLKNLLLTTAKAKRNKNTTQYKSLMKQQKNKDRPILETLIMNYDSIVGGVQSSNLFHDHAYLKTKNKPSDTKPKTNNHCVHKN